MTTTGWIATFGAPRGHRVRFLYAGAPTAPDGTTCPNRMLECECGWSVRSFSPEARRQLIEAHARHVDQVRLRPETIGARDAAAVMVEHASSDSERRLAELPHPADLEEP